MVIVAYVVLMCIALALQVLCIYAYMKNSCRSNKPLVLPLILGIAYFLISADYLVAILAERNVHVSTFSMQVLAIGTLIALITLIWNFAVEGVRCRVHEIK